MGGDYFEHYEVLLKQNTLNSLIGFSVFIKKYVSLCLAVFKYQIRQKVKTSDKLIQYQQMFHPALHLHLLKLCRGINHNMQIACEHF